MTDWTPRLDEGDLPSHLALAAAIDRDIRLGLLRAGERLPPRRRLAERLGIDFATVSRGYDAARSQGLVESHVGRGTFIAAPARPVDAPDPRRAGVSDLAMNPAPEPDDPDLIVAMRDGLAAVSANLVSLLRYQPDAGAAVDREAASIWLSRRGIVPALDRVAITPGAHATIAAVLTLLARGGDTILCEDVTYPGIRAITLSLGLRLTGLASDAEGILPDALAAAIAGHGPKALYLNPTLNNPTTRTIPASRRAEIAQVLIANRLPLIEDDACGFVAASAPAPIATLARGLTWYVGGLSKCLGPGLRLAYAVTPDARAAAGLAGALRALTLMPSPLSMALATQWISDGTADRIGRFIRAETAARQAMAAEILAGQDFDADPAAFNIWLRLPPGLGRADLASRVGASQTIGIAASDAFTMRGTPAEAVRVSLGGKADRDQLRGELHFLADTLARHR